MKYKVVFYSGIILTILIGIGGLGIVPFSSEDKVNIKIDENLDGLPNTAATHYSIINRSTFLGGSSEDSDPSIGTDNQGNIYVMFTTKSSDCPVTTGVLNQTFNGGTDIYVCKFTSNLSTLIWGTYIGGTYDDNGTDMFVDGNGDLYISGYTTSSNFPVTAGVYDQTFNGTTTKTDSFALKLASDGTQLLYSTFLPLNITSISNKSTAIYVDQLGRAYIGMTYYQSSSSTIYLCRLNATGSQILNYTGLGTGEITDIYVDEDYFIYVSGYFKNSTYDYGFLRTLTFDPPNLGGEETTPGFLSTYGQKYKNNYAYAVCADDNGTAYYTGRFEGGSVPCPYNTDGYDAMVLAIGSNQKTLNCSSIRGRYSNKEDAGTAISVDGQKRVFVTGYSESTDFWDGLCFSSETSVKGQRDAFISVFQRPNPLFEGSTDIWADTSYLIGGSGNDSATSMKLISSGVCYITGTTNSTDFPIISGANDTSYNGNGDIFVVKTVSLNDTDLDHVCDEIENQIGTNPSDYDSDNDGLSDGCDLYYGCNPNKIDTDDDFASDYEEIYGFMKWNEGITNVTNPDTDGDGLLDGYELSNATNPFYNDTDYDGLSDLDEITIYFTDPTDEDMDGDGLKDGEEIDLGTNPTDPDPDEDGLNDKEEIDKKTDPNNPDSDRDGLNDKIDFAPLNAFVPIGLIVLLIAIGVSVVSISSIKKAKKVTSEHAKYKEILWQKVAVAEKTVNVFEAKQLFDEAWKYVMENSVHFAKQDEIAFNKRRESLNQKINAFRTEVTNIFTQADILMQSQKYSDAIALITAKKADAERLGLIDLISRMDHRLGILTQYKTLYDSLSLNPFMKIEEMARIMNVTRDQLFPKLIEWAGHIDGIKIDGDDLVLEADLSAILGGLTNELNEWTNSINPETIPPPPENPSIFPDDSKKGKKGKSDKKKKK